MALVKLSGRTDLWEANQGIPETEYLCPKSFISPDFYYDDVPEMEAEIKSLLMSLSLRLCDFYNNRCS